MVEDIEDQMSWVKSPMCKGLSYDKDHNISNFKTTHFLSTIHDYLYLQGSLEIIEPNTTEVAKGFCGSGNKNLDS